MNGFILINKPRGITSYDVCHQVKKICNTKKVGHSGTLDPNADGLMIVAINKATKALQFTPSDKTYVATVELGYLTDTLDIEGETILTKDITKFTKEQLEAAISSFKGNITQIPPIYSAIKVNGKKLYEYARNGEEVEIKPRSATIHSIELIDFNDKEFTFKAHVSSGTYIRTLAKDICEKINNVGTTNKLSRTKIGELDLKDSCVLPDVKVIDIEKVINLKHYQYKNPQDILHGKKIKIDDVTDQQLLIVDENGKALAVYKQDGDIYRSVRGLF